MNDSKFYISKMESLKTFKTIKGFLKILNEYYPTHPIPTNFTESHNKQGELRSVEKFHQIPTHFSAALVTLEKYEYRGWWWIYTTDYWIFSDEQYKQIIEHFKTISKEEQFVLVDCHVHPVYVNEIKRYSALYKQPFLTVSCIE